MSRSMRATTDAMLVMAKSATVAAVPSSASLRSRPPRAGEGGRAVAARSAANPLLRMADK